MRTLSLLLLSSLTALHASQAAQETQVTARLSAGVLRLGDSAMVTLSIENAEDGRVLELPNVTGLRFGRPSQPLPERFFININGPRHSGSNLTITIPIRPEAEGNFEIPPIAVEADGKRLETKPLHLTVVQDITGADFGFLEVHPSGTKVVEGQPFAVELLFGWDEERAGKVSFAELNLPWWDSLPGTIEVEDQPISEGRVEIPVNGSLRVAAEQLESRQREGRSFITLHLVKRLLPTRSGTLEFPTSFFEFGRLRQTSFFETRRESHFVQAPPFTVEVVALPSEGQPLDYSGAVGSLAVRANADTRDVRVGDSIKLTVEWTGQGNLEYFRVPDLGALDAFRGFRVYGATEEKNFERRKVVYDLAPLTSEVQTIPAIPLTVFAPDSGRYGTIATAPIPIRVRPLEKENTLTDEENHYERDIADIDPRAPEGAAEARGGQDRFLALACAGVPLLGLLARARARKSAGDPGAPLERRRRRALKALARALPRAESPAASQAVLFEFLAARTREPAAAWIGRDFAAWAAEHAARMSPDTRKGAQEVLEALEAAVYGGGPAVPSERIAGLARTLAEAGL